MAPQITHGKCEMQKGVFAWPKPFFMVCDE